MMLEVDDIQHFLISRSPMLAARCEFLTFRRHSSGREWLKGLIEKVGTAKAIASRNPGMRCVTIGFTWNGLRALGVNEAALATFPEDFRQGMAARPEILGTTGANHPENWTGSLASQDLHAIVILFARDIAERERCRQEHREHLLQQPDGVRVLSSLDLEATPPFTYAHEHFGYRGYLSQPCIEGMGEEPTLGSSPLIKPGEFFLSYPDEDGPPAGLPEPEVLSRNGSYVAYLRLEEHVGAFRYFLRQHGDTPDQQEWVAAKLMGRWRSGAPLVFQPDEDDPELGNAIRRNNNFDNAKMNPHGDGYPLGAPILRMNPLETDVNVHRRKTIRRGGTYGPPLPEGKPDDGIERGIAAFVGCASLVRQFEFAMNVWSNKPNFHELASELDPIFGTQDDSCEMTIPERPIRGKIIGLRSFTTIRGGAYFFLPGIRALRYLSALE
jgi:deferrochelatase/peroxidase EfeB